VLDSIAIPPDVHSSTSCIQYKPHAEHMVSKPDSLLLPDEEPPFAAHLVSPRAFYEHHGIYVGGGCVIHYAGLTNRRWRGPVEEVPLADFANGHAVRIRHDQRLFTCAEVVTRARSRLGERRYRILTNNCEHFCAWVLREDCRSAQVEQLRRVPRNLYCALLAVLVASRPAAKLVPGRPLGLARGKRNVETESLAGS
jgi:Lecithin retinol acyltransferase